MKMNVTKIIEHTRKWTWQIQSQVEPTQNTRMSTSKMITIKIFDLMATPSLMSFEPSKKFMLQLQHVIYPSKNFNWSPQWRKLKCEVRVSLEWESPAPYSNAECFLQSLGCCQAKPDGLPRIVRQSYAISRRLNMCTHNDTQVRQTNNLKILWNSD